MVFGGASLAVGDGKLALLVKLHNLLTTAITTTKGRNYEIHP